MGSSPGTFSRAACDRVKDHVQPSCTTNWARDLTEDWASSVLKPDRAWNVCGTKAIIWKETTRYRSVDWSFVILKLSLASILKTYNFARRQGLTVRPCNSTSNTPWLQCSSALCISLRSSSVRSVLVSWSMLMLLTKPHIKHSRSFWQTWPSPIS